MKASKSNCQGVQQPRLAVQKSINCLKNKIISEINVKNCKTIVKTIKSEVLTPRVETLYEQKLHECFSQQPSSKTKLEIITDKIASVRSPNKRRILFYEPKSPVEPSFTTCEEYIDLKQWCTIDSPISGVDESLHTPIIEDQSEFHFGTSSSSTSFKKPWSSLSVFTTSSSFEQQTTPSLSPGLGPAEETVPICRGAHFVDDIPKSNLSELSPPDLSICSTVSNMELNKSTNFYEPISPTMEDQIFDISSLPIEISHTDPIFGLSLWSDVMTFEDSICDGKYFQRIGQCSSSNEGATIHNNNIYNIDKNDTSNGMVSENISVMFSPVATEDNISTMQDYGTIPFYSRDVQHHIGISNSPMPPSPQYIDEDSSFEAFSHNDILLRNDDTVDNSVVIRNIIGNKFISNDTPLHNGDVNMVKVNFNANTLDDRMAESITVPRKCLKLDIVQYDGEMDLVNTPDIIQNLISLEGEGIENIDLIKFITDDEIVLQGQYIAEDLKSPKTSKRKIEDSRDVEIIPKRSRCQTPEDESPDIFLQQLICKQQNQKHVTPDVEDENASSMFIKEEVILGEGENFDDSNNDPFSPCTSSTSTVEPPRPRRGRPPKPQQNVSDLNADCKDPKYRELRNKNNEASRRSRINRKQRETSMEKTADKLEEQNRILKKMADKLERHCGILKQHLLQGALSK